MAFENLETVNDLLRSATRGKFWGEITIVFRDGRPSMIKKHETIPLDGRTGHARKDNSS